MIKKRFEKIHFNYLEGPFYLPHRTTLKIFIEKLFKTEGRKIDTVNYIFCSDQYLLTINQDFLNHDTYTDIITFQYSQISEPVSSDIYISIDRVKENARLYDSPFIKELYRVIFHGALHLCGHKDKTKAEAKIMRAKEDHYLKLYVSRGTKKEKGV